MCQPLIFQKGVLTSIWSKLFEILPDAEHLLSLKPEELAGPLLVSLIDNRKNDKTVSANIIGYDNMEWEIGRSSYRIRNLNYPRGCRDDVLPTVLVKSHGATALRTFRSLVRIRSGWQILPMFVSRDASSMSACSWMFSPG